jgi:hypothetical protein
LVGNGRKWIETGRAEKRRIIAIMSEEAREYPRQESNL